MSLDYFLLHFLLFVIIFRTAGTYEHINEMIRRLSDSPRWSGGCQISLFSPPGSPEHGAALVTAQTPNPDFYLEVRHLLPGHEVVMRTRVSALLHTRLNILLQKETENNSKQQTMHSTAHCIAFIAMSNCKVMKVLL